MGAKKTGYQSITITATDNQGGGDFFSGQGVLLGNWNDPIGGYARNFDLVVPIPVDTLTTYLSNGNFGFGLDPDCHYYNQKVSLAIQTSVPEPATFFFLGTGLVGLAAIGRRKFQK